MTEIAILARARRAHGGTLMYTFSTIEALRTLHKFGYHCTIFTDLDNVEYDNLGLPIARIPNALGVALQWIKGEDFFESSDVVIAPIYSTLLLRCRKPFLFTLHDLQEKHYPENFSVFARVWRDMSNRLLTKSATYVLCESEFVKQDIIQHYRLPQQRIHVIPAPPLTSLTEFQPNEGDLPQGFHLPERYIFYPAHFWPHKNHLRLVEAFGKIARQFPGYSLIFTGQRLRTFDEVFRRVKALGLQDRVRHIGFIDTKTLANVYRGATIVVIPTLFESISIPVYEAFSLGVPVCASNVVALPDQIGDAGLLFDPTDPCDIAEKLSALLGSPTLRQQLVANGRRRLSAYNCTQYGARLRTLIDAAARDHA